MKTENESKIKKLSPEKETKLRDKVVNEQTVQKCFTLSPVYRKKLIDTAKKHNMSVPKFVGMIVEKALFDDEDEDNK